MRGREFIPGADCQAIITTIDAIAHGLAELLRDRAVMFDREVGDAAPRIQPIGRREGLGGADIKAARARAAMINFCRISAEIERGVNLAQKQPGPMGAGDKIGVLTLPAQTRLLRQGFFHHRCGIHENLHTSISEMRYHPTRQRLQAFLDHIMIIAVARIDADRRAVLPS